jgi:hypothetical protein
VNNALEALIVDVNYLEERIADGNNQRAALRERV